MQGIEDLQIKNQVIDPIQHLKRLCKE